MAVPVIKTHEEIYNALKADMLAEAPTITDYSQGSVIRALLYVIALAIRLVYIITEALYLNLFPQDADLEALKRYYEQWGLTWDDPTEAAARITVLSKYRRSAMIGTEQWYEDTVKEQFPTLVTEAYCFPNYRGGGTVDVLVKHRGNPIFESELEEIQDYFDDDPNHVLAADVLIKTAIVEEEEEAIT